jgi:hypothetical protein
MKQVNNIYSNDKIFMRVPIAKKFSSSRMRRKYGILPALILGVIMAMFITSCTKDLDTEPLDPNITTTNKVFKDTLAFKEALAKVYGGYALTGQQGPAGDPDISGIDEGFSNYLRQYWNCQELTTDEAVIGWNDATIKDFHYQTWTPSDVFVTAMYYRIMYQITLANDFISHCNEYSGKLSGKSLDEVKHFKAEARFLRALTYWHGLDLFGNMPFITENDKVGSFFPKQTDRKTLFSYIEKELLDIEPDLVDARKNEYGRADKAADWTLLAKLYLNAEIYTGQKMYDKVITYTKKVIDAGYQLQPVYAHLFCADNDKSPEIIFSINFDGQYTRTYGGMVYIIHAAVGGNMKPEEYGIGGGWAGTRTTSAFVNKFSDITGNTDSRAMFHTSGQNLEINDIGSFTDGYAIKKFKNLTSTGASAPHANPDFVDTDYPMFRLADVFLMYAEANLRGGGGDKTLALNYINQLRKRAYGNDSGNITDAQLTLDFILDERARELYWEGHRRTDLIRFNKFTGDSYVWPWKGNVKEGTKTDSYRDLFPIPSSDLNANPNLKQNSGY